MTRGGTAVAVTGRGACTPAGDGVAALWSGLRRATATMRRITHFSTEAAALGSAGFVPGPGEEPDAPERTLDLATRSVAEASRDAGSPPTHRTALVLGTTEPGEVGLPTGDGAQPPPDRFFAGLLAARCAARFPAFGEALTVASASASGAVGIAVGRDMVLAGDADTVFVGGADALVETAFHGLSSLRTLSPEGCRPFTRVRRGIGVSEGAGMLHLEPLDRARRRGAYVHALLAGAAVTNATDHLATPRAAGIRLAVEQALADAGLDPDAVDLINVHGPGPGRATEWRSTRCARCSGPALPRIPIVSTKSVLWHLQGAAGAVEALACVLSLEHATLTPTRVTGEPDPAFADLDLVPAARPAPGLRTALSISCGLGGLNAALVFTKGSHA
uniref:AtaPKS3 protein n=1 Tax=Saccharothrix mutabilis subsp. capreolus TaxID=66854 RepID=Q83W19_STRMP|nr:AtaPKS3 protein [Saccharothrix mutabilis subsp. capreolus]